MKWDRVSPNTAYWGMDLPEKGGIEIPQSKPVYTA